MRASILFSRRRVIIPHARRFPLNVANARSRAFRQSLFLMQEKEPYEHALGQTWTHEIDLDRKTDHDQSLFHHEEYTIVRRPLYHSIVQPMNSKSESSIIGVCHVPGEVCTIWYCRTSLDHIEGAHQTPPAKKYEPRTWWCVFPDIFIIWNDVNMTNTKQRANCLVVVSIFPNIIRCSY